MRLFLSLILLSLLMPCASMADNKKDKNKLLQIRMSVDDLAKLDAIAATEKRTRSDVIRILISRGVNNGESEKVAI